VLTFETSKCLAHPSFLWASQESMMFVLKMETLNIESEVQLVEACKNLANSMYV